MKRFISILTICAICVMQCAASMGGVAAASSEYAMTVNEGSTIKAITDSMYGINEDWVVGGKDDYVVDADGRDYLPNMAFKSTFADTRLPLIRIGEAASQRVFWKDTIGDYDSRPEYTLWSQTGKIEFGLVEMIKFYQGIDPAVEFSISLNMNDTTANAADLAEFLTGDSTTEWGSKRIAYGIAKPVRVKMYQLGNENDYIGNEGIVDKMDAAAYVEKSKEIITAIKAKDADAVFGAIGGTALYEAFLNRSEYDDTWIKAIVGGLQDDISCLTFNWYFVQGSTYKVDLLKDKINTTIREVTGSNDIKLCMTEFAESIYEISTGQTVPHNLAGVLTTADFYVRNARDVSMDTAIFHAMNSSDWITAWHNNGQWGLTGIGMLQNMMKKYAIGNVVDSTLTGYSAGVAADVVGMAVKPDENTTNLIFVNAGDSQAEVTFDLGSDYLLAEESVLKSTKDTPAKTDITINGQTGINTYSNIYAKGEDIRSYTLPAYSVCALQFTRQTSGAETIFSEDFDHASVDDYALIQNGTEEGIGVSIANGALVLDGIGDNGSTFENNYTYMPLSNQVGQAFTIKMDVAVTAVDGGSFGLVYGASGKENLDTSGTGNVVLFTEDGVKESQYTNGTETECQQLVTTNAPALRENETYALQLAVTGTSVTVLADNKVIYTRNISTPIDIANVGLLFSDICVSVDAISVAFPEKTEAVNREFEYEQNFNTVKNGTLPEGFLRTSGAAKAYAENGALYIENNEWYTNEGVLIPCVDNVLNENLVIEADIKMESVNQDAINGKAIPIGGIFFAADGKQQARVGLHGHNTGLRIEDKNGQKVLKDISYNSTDTRFNEGGTVSVKIVCSRDTTPTVYVNGVPFSYDKTAIDINDTGYVGFYATASKIKVDNLRISGKQQFIYPAEETVKKAIDFEYEENFDGIANGELPVGWKLIDESTMNGGSLDDSSVAKVENGALTFESRASLIDPGYGSYLLFDFDDVMREGLTMECDIKKTKESPADNNNTCAGLMYGVVEDGKGGIANASYFAPKTTDGSGDGNMHVRDWETGKPIYNREGRWLRNSDIPGVGQGSDGRKLWANNKTMTIRLRLVFRNDTNMPTAYIDGRRVSFDHTAYSTDPNRIKSGKIGLYAFNSYVSIDNIKVTGKQLRTIPKQELVKKTVDFKYEENFNGIANGDLPAGWKLIDEANLTGDSNFTKENSADIKVKDGALKLRTRVDPDTYPHGAYLLFDYDGVKREGLTMECDITKVNDPAKNVNNSFVGLMYGVVENEAAGKLSNASYYAPKTNGGSAYDGYIHIRDWKNPGVICGGGNDSNFSGWICEGYPPKDTGNVQKKLWTGNATNTIHLRLVFNDDTNPPAVYVGEDRVSFKDVKSNTDANRIVSGKIGLCVYNADVSIDNIKVTGKQEIEAVREVIRDSVKVLTSNYDTAAKQISVKVQVTKTDAAAKNVWIALYKKQNHSLVNVGAAASVGESLSMFETDLTLNGVENYSSSEYEVSIFVWDADTMSPAVSRLDITV